MTTYATTRCDAADLPQSRVDPESPADSFEDVSREVLATAIRTANLVSFGMSPAAFEQIAFQLFVAPLAALLSEVSDGEVIHGRRPEHEMINAILVEVRRFPNPYLALRCLPIVFRLPCSAETQTELADEFGVSRADVSKYCVEMTKRFSIPPGRGMRTDETREKYAARQRGKRARPLPMRYGWAGIGVSVKGVAA